MQTNPDRAPLFIRRRLRRYVKGSNISRVALYQGWRYIKILYYGALLFADLQDR